MTTSTRKRTHLDRVDSGKWLARMLADVPRCVAKEPKPQAIRRMRQRLLAELKRPTKAAA